MVKVPVIPSAITTKQHRPLVLCMAGPTAIGKTALACLMAKYLGGEIINVDSVQLYRHLNVGSAKPTPAITVNVKHHLIDLREVTEPYSAGDFMGDALAAVASISSRGKIPLLVGGTMFYFKTLMAPRANLPPQEPQLRARLQRLLTRYGSERLHRYLATKDPLSATRIPATNSQRVQRAVEVFLLTGKPLSSFPLTNPVWQNKYRIVKLALLPTDRKDLDKRAVRRVQEMLADGLVPEVEGLLRHYGSEITQLPALKSVGYRQVVQYLNGELTQAQLEPAIISATRRLIRHQLTWLRSWADFIPIYLNCKNPIRE